MKLKDGKEGEIVELVKINLSPELNRRLSVLGFTKGAKIQIIHKRKKGAMAVKIRGSRFALGKKAGENIIVRKG